MNKKFYAPGTDGYVYYAVCHNGKYAAQYESFKSSYQRHYFENIVDMVNYYVDNQKRADFIINKLKEE